MTGKTDLAGTQRLVRDWWLLAAVLLLWMVASVFGWLPHDEFPDLQSLAGAAVQLITGKGGVLGSLAVNTGASVGRFAAGYALSIVVGLTLGLLMASSVAAAQLLLPVLRFLYPIPSLAWTPLVIMWCGLGEKSVIVLIFLTAVWPVIYGAYDGLRAIPIKYLNVANQLDATWSFRVRKVLIPAALPILVSSLRIAHGMGWRAIIGAEMIAALSGLGYMLNMAGELRRPDVIVLGMIVIAVISVVFDRIIFGPIERRLIRMGI
jgi:taurine transport system permease protein